MPQRFIDPARAAVVALFIVSVAAPVMAAQAQQAVGSVTLVLGQATVVSSAGARRPIYRGITVTPGDLVETAQGGHVHIRFIDDALVSVRPSSRLLIEEYQYNPAQVAQSQVRFRLETGVARAISGAAAEGAKERFRLNTPLVAIGVRGTDFVVSSQFEQTTAHVNQGAIVMTPLGAGCSADALGPCNTNAAMLVSAQMGDVLAEYRSGLSHPEIKPQLLARSTYFAAVPVEGLQPSPGNGGGGTQTAKLDDSASAKPESVVVQVSSAIRNDFIAAVVGGSVEPPAAVVQPPGPAVLAWGHWSRPTGSSDFSEPFRVAAIGREVTVGNTSHVLYRSFPAEGGATSIQASVGEVSFKLQQTSAQFLPWGGVSQDAVAHDGALRIDFAARKYQTTLQLDNAIAGNHTLTSSGVVLADGIFGGASGGQTVIGATTLDGKGAGYFFDKTVDRGVFNGITLWGK